MTAIDPMLAEPVVELSSAQLIRRAAECADLRRKSDELLAKSQRIIARADHALRHGHEATDRMRRHMADHRGGLPPM